MKVDSRLRAIDDRAINLARRVLTNPTFYWTHPWMIGDGLALILTVGGVFNVSRSWSRSHYADALAWSSMTVGGVGLFVLNSLFPRPDAPERELPPLVPDARRSERITHWLKTH
jgi:hypothetical protein